MGLWSPALVDLGSVAFTGGRPGFAQGGDSREPALSKVEGRLSLRELFRRQLLFRREVLFCWDPVDFFFDRAFVGETSPLQDRFAVLDHFGMAAEVGYRVASVEAPLVGVFAEDVGGATDFASPFCVVPGTAYRWDMLEPR